jgi:hypothetical protein
MKTSKKLISVLIFTLTEIEKLGSHVIDNRIKKLPRKRNEKNGIMKIS